jgi:hypothetical protein
MVLLKLLIDDILDLSKVEAKKIALENLAFDPRSTVEDARVSPAVPPVLRGDAHRLDSQNEGKATVRFTIADTGIGMRPDQIALIFAPFTQADASMTRKYAGSGLGLAICKKLVELMGGTIGIDSREGQGSTFWFTAVFDLAPPSQQPPDNERRMERSGPTTVPKGNRQILVVEDNATNREVVLAPTAEAGIPSHGGRQRG